MTLMTSLRRWIQVRYRLQKGGRGLGGGQGVLLLQCQEHLFPQGEGQGGGEGQGVILGGCLLLCQFPLLEVQCQEHQGEGRGGGEGQGVILGGCLLLC